MSRARRVVPGETAGGAGNPGTTPTGGTTALGAWRTLKNAPPIAAGTALVLTDGTIVVQNTEGPDWWRLTPDIHGSYLNGTWSSLPLTPNGYAPLFFASAVLPDGRLLVEGGEYEGPTGARTESLTGAIYDPVTNTWAPVAPPPGWSCIGDASSVVLPDGRFLLASCWGSEDAVLDAKTLTWSRYSSGKRDNGHEEGWTLLQNGNVLVVDTLDFGDLRASEVLDTKTARWSFAGDTPEQLSNLSLSNPVGSHEIGPQVLRPDGTVWAVGASGHTAIYHPAGHWTKGPELPYVPGEGQLDVTDGPGALLPNGHVMVVTNPGDYRPPIHIFDFDGAALTEIVGPPQAYADSAYNTNLLVLPSGEILFTDESNDVEIFTPTGRALAWAAPVIDPDCALDVLAPGASYAISGKQLNGLSQASMYGDDAQAATNYPLVRITNLATGHVFYARTHDHGSMSVAPGNPSRTFFDVSPAQEVGASKLEVVANGIASVPVFVTVRAR